MYINFLWFLTAHAEIHKVLYEDPGGFLFSFILLSFLNQSKTSPFFIISRHAPSQLSNHYGKAGGALIQDNNTPWAFRATAQLRACTALLKPNWVVEQGETGCWLCVVVGGVDVMSR